MSEYKLRIRQTRIVMLRAMGYTAAAAAAAATTAKGYDQYVSTIKSPSMSLHGVIARIRLNGFLMPSVRRGTSDDPYDDMQEIHLSALNRGLLRHHAVFLLDKYTL